MAVIYEDIKRKITGDDFNKIEDPSMSRDDKIKSYADELIKKKKEKMKYSPNKGLKFGGVGCAVKLCPDPVSVTSSEFLTTVSDEWGFDDEVYVYNRDGKSRKIERVLDILHQEEKRMLKDAAVSQEIKDLLSINIPSILGTLDRRFLAKDFLKHEFGDIELLKNQYRHCRRSERGELFAGLLGSFRSFTAELKEEDKKLISLLEDYYNHNYSSVFDTSDSGRDFLPLLAARRAVNRVQNEISEYAKKFFPSDPVGWTVPVLLLKNINELKILGEDLYQICKWDKAIKIPMSIPKDVEFESENRKNPYLDPDWESNLKKLGIERNENWNGGMDLLGIYIPFDKNKYEGNNHKTIDGFPPKADSVICLFMEEIIDFSNRLFEPKNVDFVERQIYNGTYINFCPLYKRYGNSRIDFSRNRVEKNIYNNNTLTLDAYEKVIAHVLCHEVFHAYQDYHIGWLNASLSEPEAEAEYFALNYVRKEMRDYELAALLCDATNHKTNKYRRALTIFGKIFQGSYPTFVDAYTYDQNTAIHNVYGW